MIDKALLEILACPLCKNGVSFNNGQLICRACRRSYPVKDGIPIMLIEEARIIKDEVKENE